MRAKIRKATLVVVFVVLGLNFSVKAEDVYEEWVARWDGPLGNDDYAVAMALDQEGNVYVTGATFQSYEDIFSLYNYATVKYSPTGMLLWSHVFDGPGKYDESAQDIAVAPNGTLYVTGNSDGITTINYSPQGETLWVQTYRRPVTGEANASAMAVDKDGYIYITGYSWGTMYDYTTLKYSPEGWLWWDTHYNGPASSHDEANDIAVDDSGYVYVTGRSGSKTEFWYDYNHVTIKYGSFGETVWVRTFDGPAGYPFSAGHLAIDGSGNVFVSGPTYNTYRLCGHCDDYGTVKYDRDGHLQWFQRYQGPWLRSDVPSALGVDKLGNVFVTGSSVDSGTAYDYTTIGYSPAGDTLWLRRYSQKENYYSEGANAMAVDEQGNVYVSGYSGNDFQQKRDVDCLTLKYSNSGDLLWSKAYDGPAGGSDVAVGVAKYAEYLYVCARSVGVGTSYDFTTIRYSPCTPSSPKSGDASADDLLSIADVVSVISYLFGYSVPPTCDDNLYDCWVYQRLCRYDWNGDKKITLGDCVRALNFLFQRPGEWSPVASLGCCPFPQ